MKIAIVGSRDFNNYEILEETLSTLQEPITEIISGGAQGADTLAEQWAKIITSRSPSIRQNGVNMDELPARNVIKKL